MELKSFSDQTHQTISETPEPLPRLALVIRQYLQEHQIAYTEQQSHKKGSGLTFDNRATRP